MNGNRKCTLYFALGQDDFEYIDVSSMDSTERDILRQAFGRSGFAQKNDKYKFLPCPLGTFVNSSDSDYYNLECQECPAGGFYSDSQAFVNDGCRRCPIGTFVPYDKAPGKSGLDCDACPQGTNTDEFPEYRACSCLEGSHRTHFFKGCKRCELGLECANESVTLRKGYWWKWRNETHKELYERFADNLVKLAFTPIVKSRFNRSLIEFPYALPHPHHCPNEESCLGGMDSLCAVGCEGPLCEVCSTGYYKHLKTCTKCPTKKWMIGKLLILVVVIVIIAVVGVWIGRKKAKKIKGRSSVDIILGKLKIVMGFYQVTSGLLEAFSSIKWPDALVFIGKYSQLLQMNVLQIAPVHCLFDNIKINAFGNLYALLAMNVLAILVAFAVYGLRKLILRRKLLNEEQKLKEISKTKELIYKNLFFFLYVTYLSTCSTTANVLPLACRRVCADQDEKICDKFLKVDFSIKCSGSKYDHPLIVAYCALGYILILPAAAFYALWRQRDSLRNRDNGDENETSSSQEQSTEVVTGLRFLYENYNGCTWYWEFVDIARKIAFTSGLMLLGGKSRPYVGLAFGVAGLYCMLFASKKPIADPFENKLMLTSLTATSLNLGIGLVSRFPEENIATSSDPNSEDIGYNIMVFGANTLVIGLLIVQYIQFLYRYIKEWRKNPKWSLSCLLAMLLPLKEFHGEIQGMIGTNIFDTQLQTGHMDMPSISTALQDSGAVAFDLEEDKTNRIEERNGDETTTNEEMGIELSFLTLAKISLHELPRETDVPSTSSEQESGTVTIDIEEEETSPTEGRNDLKTTSNMPSVFSAVHEGRTVTINIEKDETNPTEGKNDVKASVNMPSMSSAVQKSETVTINIEKDETNPTEGKNDVKTASNVPSMFSAAQESGTVTIDIEDDTNPTEGRNDAKTTSNATSMSSAIPDSTVVTIDLEEDETNSAEGRSGDETTTYDEMGIELSFLTPANISLHEPGEINDTPL